MEDVLSSDWTKPEALVGGPLTRLGRAHLIKAVPRRQSVVEFAVIVYKDEAVVENPVAWRITSAITKINDSIDVQRSLEVEIIVGKVNMCHIFPGYDSWAVVAADVSVDATIISRGDIIPGHVNLLVRRTDRGDREAGEPPILINSKLVKVLRLTPMKSETKGELRIARNVRNSCRAIGNGTEILTSRVS